MKTRRALALLVFFHVLLFAATACSRRDSGAAPADSSGYERLTLRYEGSTGTVSPPELAEALGYFAPIKLEYVGNSISGPLNIQNAVTGDVDFGGAFNGAVLKLFAAKAPIKAVVGAYGIDKEVWTGFYVLEDSPLRSARDLIGKKIAMNTLGAHHEFVLKEYLNRNHLTKDEQKQVTLVVVPPVNAEQALRQNQVDVAVLGSIFREKGLERGGLRLLFSDYDLFGQFSAGTYVLRTDFIQKNPKVARKFVEAVSRALRWSESTPREQVIAKFEEIVRARHRAEDTAALKYFRGYGVPDGGQIREADLKRWIDWLVQDGQLEKDSLSPSDVFVDLLPKTAAL